MNFSRLECREILAHVHPQDIDPDVLAKLQEGAQQSQTTVAASQSITVNIPHAQTATLVKDDGMPAYTPIAYTDEQLAKINKDRPEGTPPVTQADVAEINRQKEAAHVAEWTFRKNYKPNLNVNDAVNAAFAAPDRPAGFTSTVRQHAIGELNEAGDRCVHIDVDGNSVFVCSSGHGYIMSPSLRACPHCFTAGATVVQTDRGAVAGMDSNW